MRLLILATVFTALAMPSAAKDSGEAAFDLLAQYTAQTQKKNYIKLQSSIKMEDAKAIDAKISELYGEPRVSRSGLKVWEVKNDGTTVAKHTTIMCGPDGNGGIIISADRRKPNVLGANTKSKRRAQKQANKNLRSIGRTKSSSRSALRSQERD